MGCAVFPPEAKVLPKMVCAIGITKGPSRINSMGIKRVGSSHPFIHTVLYMIYLLPTLVLRLLIPIL